MLKDRALWNQGALLDSGMNCEDREVVSSKAEALLVAHGLIGAGNHYGATRFMKSSSATFRRLEADKIIETVKALHDRIEERFPGSGLGKVVGELQQVAEETVDADALDSAAAPVAALRRGGAEPGDHRAAGVSGGAYTAVQLR